MMIEAPVALRNWIKALDGVCACQIKLYQTKSFICRTATFFFLGYRHRNLLGCPSFCSRPL